MTRFPDGSSRKPDHQPARRAGPPAALLLIGAGLMLGGCAATEKLMPSTDNGGSVFGNLLAFGTTKPGPVPAGAAHDAPLQCPAIEVLDGTAAYRTYTGADQSNGSVRYQFSMGDVARDCTHSGGQILLKVGVAGRVLLGPAGTPGSFTVPVRIAVRRESDQTAAVTKLYDVPATIAAGQDATDFQLVSDPIAVPFVTSQADGDYTILVGFDAAKPAAAAPKMRSRGRKGAPPAAEASPPPNG